jgi:thiamine monophosphate kinase
LLGFGYLVQVTQARAIGASSIDEGEKMYLTGSLGAGEKLFSTLHCENTKDKVLLEQPVLIIPRCESKTICSHSDFLTITHTRIYKSQNDP